MMNLWASAAILAASPVAASQADLDRLAATMGYRYTILTNRPASCPTGTPRCFEADIAITIPDAVPGVPFEIRYSLVNPVLRIDSDLFDNRTVNGDMNVLTVKPGRSLKPGQTYHIRLTAVGAFFSRNHMMPHATLAAPGLSPRVIAATRTGTDAETGLESLPFVAPMTDEAALARSAPDDQTVWRTPERAYALYAERGVSAAPIDVAILPKPMTATRPGGPSVDLSKGVAVTTSGIDRAAITPALNALAVGQGAVPIKIRRQAGMSPEGYRLTVGKGGVAIDAADAAGASYALRSLTQQIAAEGTVLRPLMVQDAPRYGFRGLHIDLARNFHSKTEILKLIEQMAAYKLNRLHLHLGDDEGWRLQIAGLPELTEVGAYRCADLSEKTCLQPQLGADPARDAATNGYLTAADYGEILHAAAARQIEVIPSFDMPGHSRAAIRSMEVRYQRLIAKGDRAGAERYRLVEPGDTTRYSSVQHYDDNTLNVCIDSTYRFIDQVIDAIAALHKAAGVPLTTYHIGADETAGAWKDSPACKVTMAREGLQPRQLGARFIERVAADLAKRGIAVAGWSDGLGHTDPARMPSAVQTNIWSNLHGGGVAEAHGQANRGWKTVLSIPDLGYFDMPYAADPNETGYDWASRGVDSFQVFGFMPGNLAANAALIPNILAQPKPIADTVPLQSGRAIAGIQAQLWSETVRRDSQVDYMLFPRLLALAERAWAKPDWEPTYVAGTGYEPNDARVDRARLLAGWGDFAGRMGVQMRLLDRAGVTYRLAPPGARIAGGRLEANAEFPGTPIEYRTGGTAWRRYDGPVVVTGAVDLRTRTPDGRRASRTVTVSP